MLSIYISINFCILGQFCDLGVPRLPRAIRYYIILVIGREGKWQSPFIASRTKANIIQGPLPMNTEELSNRLTQIVQGITNTHPIRIKATIEVFLEEFDPSQNYLLSISDIEGYETQFIEFEIWDEKDGPIPGIKLFKDLNIYLEREFCEY